MDRILNVERLTAGYGRSIVIHEISIEVGEGEIVGMVGPNGSGKSTLLKSVVRLTNVFGGNIKFEGNDISYVRPHMITRLGISYVPQVLNVFSNLTVGENLELGAIARNDKSAIEKNIEEILTLFPMLKKLEERKPMFLSGGERQMLAISRAMLSKPKLLLLDEPAASLSPKIVGDLFDRLKEINRRGVTLVIVEQNVDRVLSISDRGYVFVSGRKVLEGSGEELRSKDLGKVFLGRR